MSFSSTRLDYKIMLAWTVRGDAVAVTVTVAVDPSGLLVASMAVRMNIWGRSG